MSSSTWDKNLREKRNKRIAKRFDYWYNKKRIRIEDVMYKLKWEEFFLSYCELKKIIKAQGKNIPKVNNNKLHDSEKHSKTVQARNYYLIERFKYLTEEKRKRIDDVLNQLANDEFYISVKICEKIIYEGQ